MNIADRRGGKDLFVEIFLRQNPSSGIENFSLSTVDDMDRFLRVPCAPYVPN